MLISSISLLTFVVCYARAAPRILHSPLPTAWHHEPNHPVHALFRRAPGDGVTYPPVGTPEWSSTFPPPGRPPNPADIPQNWIAALNAAVDAGKIPDIPQSVEAVYPQGINPNSPEICSSTAKCRIPGDIWDAPEGVFASSFDDGPLQLTPQLVDFLGRNGNLTTTHFMIGVNILYNPNQFLSAFDAGHDIAVHTWSHPHMTSLSNVDIVGQLGWTMQLIHNSTGGRVPRYWRPPYGDSDMRVRAIAKEVFGLTTVIWNQDSGDWGAFSAQTVTDTMAGFLSLPKQPGLVTLNHELSSVTVNGFIASFPLIAQNGWNWASLAQVVFPDVSDNGGGSAYQNANSSTSNVSLKGVLVGDSPAASSTTTTTTRSTSSEASSSTTMSSNTASSPSRSASIQNQSNSSSSSSTTPHLFILALSLMILHTLS